MQPTHHKNPLISFLIVSYRTPALLRRALQSIQMHCPVSFEVIVHDNHSADGTVEMLRRDFGWVKCLASPENLGFAAGNNRAYEFASGDFIFFLNPDAEITPGSIEKMLHEFSLSPETAMVTPRLHYPDGSLQRSVRNDYSFFGSLVDNRIFPSLFGTKTKNGHPAFWDHQTRRTIHWAKGAALMVRKAVLDQVGVFDERFWIYGEEIDLCKRIRNAGYSIVFIPDAIVIHHEKQSTRQQSSRMFLQNYKSHYLLLQKHYRPIDLHLYFVRSLATVSLWTVYWALTSLFRPSHARQPLSSYAGVLHWHLRFSPLIPQHHA